MQVGNQPLIRVSGLVAVAGMKKRQANSRVLSLVAAALLMASVSTAQSDPCYCTVQVRFNWFSLEWEVANCNSNCLPGEGACLNIPTVLADGTQVRVCGCLQADGSYKAPNCYCSGKVINPDFEEDQQTSAVECTELQACPTETFKCSANHLFAFPGAWVEACKCQG